MGDKKEIQNEKPTLGVQIKFQKLKGKYSNVIDKKYKQ